MRRCVIAHALVGNCATVTSFATQTTMIMMNGGVRFWRQGEYYQVHTNNSAQCNIADIGNANRDNCIRI